MSESNKTIELELELLRDDVSDDALLVSDGTNEWWVPRSQCEYDKVLGTLTIPEWLAFEKGMI